MFWRWNLGSIINIAIGNDIVYEIYLVPTIKLVSVLGMRYHVEISWLNVCIQIFPTIELG